jgi:mannose-6-phosphate isomerase
MQPIALPANTLASFYSGAGQIGRFREDAMVEPTHAEDWIASTITRFRGPAGETRFGDVSLADLLASDPEAWFGREYIKHLGRAHVLLTKLLDAGTRLPLHVHPDRAFARANLNSELGKTEAWLVLHADPGASARLGFARDVGATELADWVERQDVDILLGTCNEVAVKSGDVVFCPAGVPHSIGAGMLILEIQEMTDFSIMLEWAGFPIDPSGVFLGLSADTALEAVNRNAVTGAALDDLRGQVIKTLASGAEGATSLLPPRADAFFRAEQIIAATSAVSLDARFAVLIVNEGSGVIQFEHADPVEVSAGAIYLIPHAAGSMTISGPLSAIRCAASVLA